MKFGVTFPQTEIGSDPIAIRDYVQAVEGAGFDYLGTFEHVLGAHPDRFLGAKLGFPSPPYLYDSQFHEPFALFSFVAALTSRIELVTSVVVLPQRQTALVAKQAAEVDLLSGGRFRLGVGVGWNFTEYEALNEDFHSRGARQEEQILVLRRLWTEDLVTFEGRWHKLDRVGILPRPGRAIPIWIGGGAENRLLRRVARLADGWMPILPLSAETPQVLDRLHGYLERAGRDVSSFGLQAGLMTGRGSETDWVRDAKRWQSLGATHLGIGGSRPDSTPLQALERAIGIKQVLSKEL